MTITQRQSSGAAIPEWTTADRMRKAREHGGYTQVQLSEVTGLSRRTISSVESGEREPNRAALNLYQMATGVPREWLQTGRADSSGPEPTGPQATQDTFN